MKKFAGPFGRVYYSSLYLTINDISYYTIFSLSKVKSHAYLTPCVWAHIYSDSASSEHELCEIATKKKWLAVKSYE